MYANLAGSLDMLRAYPNGPNLHLDTLLLKKTLLSPSSHKKKSKIRDFEKSGRHASKL